MIIKDVIVLAVAMPQHSKEAREKNSIKKVVNAIGDTMIINSETDLEQHVDSVLNNWNFDSPKKEMVPLLTWTIWWMDDSPAFGAEWGAFLKKLEWDKLIAKADGECKTRHSRD